MKSMIRMAVASHLSDAQALMQANPEAANDHINFAKELLFRYDNIDERVEWSELDDIWREVTANR